MLINWPSWIKNLFVDPTAHWQRVVIDPVLGEMRLNDDATWWSGNVESAGLRFEVNVTGTGEPDARLMAEARSVVTNAAKFKRTIDSHLEEAAITQFPKMARELRQLRIESVAFLWPTSPTYCEIYFDAPSEDRSWTCGYEDGVPVRLTYSN
jgi:hypothetical protein